MQTKQRDKEGEHQTGRRTMFNNKETQAAYEQDQEGGDFDFFNKLLASIDNNDDTPAVEAFAEGHQVPEVLDGPVEHHVLKIPP